LTQPDDAELVLAAQAGDAAALGMLLDRHRARMKAVAVGLLGARGDIQDVVQDACLQAVRRITDVRDPDAAGRWLVSIVANACRARLRRPPVEAATDDADMLHGAANSVDDAVERAALRDWVWTALGRLPESLRLAVVLRYFSTASSYESIAAVCGVPVGTVRSRLHAARAQLAEELLATVAARHDDAVAYQRHARDIAEAMLTFYRSGDRSHLAGHLARDLRFALADRVERQVCTCTRRCWRPTSMTASRPGWSD
jgi:RNA polymerase sigma factor (sigma-70 family)